MGMMKAAVLPEPVTAPPTRSLPRRAMGMVLSWIGVGVSKPTEARPRRIGLDRDIVWKEPEDFDFVFFGGGFSTGAKKSASLALSSAFSSSSVSGSSLLFI